MTRSHASLALTLTIAVALGSCPRAFAAVNLLPNPGFEAAGGSFGPWFSFGGAAISTAATDNIFRSGAAAAKLYGKFPNCPIPTFNASGAGQTLTPIIGSVYELSGWSFVSSADPIIGADICASNRAVAKVVFFNAAVGGIELASNEVLIGSGNSVQNQWNPFSISLRCPAGALRAEALILFLQPGCATGAVYVDDAFFCESIVPLLSNQLTNPGFNGGLAGWSTFGNVFHDPRPGVTRSPVGSAKLFSTFVFGADSGMYQSFAATPGSSWELSAYGLNTCLDQDELSGTNDNMVLGRIVFRDAATTEIGSNDFLLVDAATPLGSWTFGSETATAPAGAATAQAYFLFVSPSLSGGAAFLDDASFRELAPVAAPTLPAPFALHQNSPNPFNPSTEIAFELSRDDFAELRVFDTAGHLITTLHSGLLSAGSHSMRWDGMTAAGGPAATGVYQYVLTTSAGRTSRSMVLVK